MSYFEQDVFMNHVKTVQDFQGFEIRSFSISFNLRFYSSLIF